MGPLQVFLRKRPLSEKAPRTDKLISMAQEVDKGDYDALTVLPGKPRSKEVVLHNCVLEASKRKRSCWLN